ncbi:oligosaccharide flippase family protein [Desulfocapsa sulfexigens]|uniref:oligosaccharide flippase family protein n=1 Tax=Desulfocapsa sulfexigens TaxID=65555 RepID=UPI0005A52851|nr:oligosaccharide flippase family protein [Desulfocapsa sulfexigens]
MSYKKKNGQIKPDFDLLAGNSEKNSNLRSSTFRGGIVTVVAEAVIFILYIASISLLSRLLVPDDFGVVAVVTAAVAIVLSIQEAGVADVIVRLPTVSREQFDKAFWFNLTLAGFLCVFVVLLAPVLGWIYKDSRITNITLSFAGVIFLSNLPIINTALLKRRLLMGRVALIKTVSFAFAVSVAAYAAISGLSYWSLVILQLTKVGSTLLLTFFLCPVFPSSPNPSNKVKGIVKDGSYFSAGAFFASVGRNADNLLVGFFNGNAVLGEYNRAFALLLMPLSQLVTPVGSVAIPVLSRLAGEPERYKNAYVQITTRLLMLTTPGIAILVVIAEPLCQVVLGPGWGQVPVLFRWLGIAGIVQPFTISLSWLMVSQGRAYEHFRNMLINTILLVLLFFLSAPHGAESLAMAYGVSGILLRSPLISWAVLRKGPVLLMDGLKVVTPGIYGAVVAASIALISITLFQAYGHVVNLLIAVSGSCTLTVVMYLMLPLTRNIVFLTITSSKSSGPDK